jgi:hypothetical protein
VLDFMAQIGFCALGCCCSFIFNFNVDPCSHWSKIWAGLK